MTLSTYNTTAVRWSRGIIPNFNPAITSLSLMVGPLRASRIGYYSVGIGSVAVTDEVPLLRTPSQEVTTPVESFLNTIRYRDRHCVLMGWPVLGASYDDWTGFNAAHIFPLEYEGHWNDHDFSKWITFPPATKSDGSINSPQNGILLNASAHAFFYSYHVSINPDVQNPRSSSLRS